MTAGNASGINDGAAVVVLMTRENAEKREIEPLARIVSWATAGVDPAIMGTGPIPASRRALEKAGWNPDDLHLVEANEAFAAQACAVNKDLGWDTGKVNVNGGAIALGHPVGASGARVLTTLLYEMRRRDAKKGLATLCIGRRDGHRDVRGARLTAVDGRRGQARRQTTEDDGRRRKEAASMGHVAIVTGGTRGIGGAVSVALQDAGHTVAATYAGNDDAAKRFGDRTGLRTYKFDVSDFEACRDGVDRITKESRPGRGPGEQRGDYQGTETMHPHVVRPVERGAPDEPLVVLQHVPLRD